MEHDYPGNVRELENIIEQAFVLCRGGVIETSHLPAELRPRAGHDVGGGQPLSLEEMERVFIAEALQRRDGNRKRAAEDLGIDVSTLYRKIRSLEIPVPESDGRGRRR
jgi:DNA-binding NtrC family response regulator